MTAHVYSGEKSKLVRYGPPWKWSTLWAFGMFWGTDEFDCAALTLRLGPLGGITWWEPNDVDYLPLDLDAFGHGNYNDTITPTCGRDDV